MAIATVGTAVFNAGFSYFQEDRKLKHERRQKIIQIETEMSNMLQNQARFQARSGVKSPAGQKIIARDYSEQIQKVAKA